MNEITMDQNITTSMANEQTSSDNEIVLYQPDSTLTLDVRLGNDTVWLTQAQMTDLFMRDRTVITRHINNIFKEHELEEKSNVHFLHIANSDKPVKLYSLDVIISVGYRVKSVRGTQFRQWANKVLKDYLLRGYAVNQRFLQLENRIDRKFSEYDRHFQELDNKVDFFIRSSYQPIEGVFYDGQIFDAYAFIAGLIRQAKSRIVIIDNYLDESVLVQLTKRSPNVKVDIYTPQITKAFRQDVEKHNTQYPGVKLHKFTKGHDRFLIIDEAVYHIGASLKDLGKKLFGFSRMEYLEASELLNRIEKKNQN